MKQMQFSFNNRDTLEKEIQKIERWKNRFICSKFVFQIFTDIMDKQKIEDVLNILKQKFPGTLIFGASSSGNILNGDFEENTFVMICTIFEYPDTETDIVQYEYTETSIEEVPFMLKAEVEKRSWVKAIILLGVIRYRSMTPLCDGLSEIEENIKIAGGGAFASDLDSDRACIFTNKGYSDNGIAFLLLGGENLHIETSYVTGWKPLGSYFDITKTEDYFLQEINGEKAYAVYYKYLHIKNDENFFYNTLEFPIIYRHNGLDIMRAPTKSNPDGSLTMTCHIEEGVKGRIAYGDPATILSSIKEESKKMINFAPEAITVFSCAARRTFWGNSEVGKETSYYQRIAPTNGFYTSGEFLRTGKWVNQHNVTQVIFAMREGDCHPVTIEDDEKTSYEGKVSIISRMATFINATTKELEESNRKLKELAVMDAMTGIWNRNAYVDEIENIQHSIKDVKVLIATFDLNGLKQINDNYGHEAGDMALCDATSVLSEVVGKDHLYRTGGDEFVALLRDTTHEEIQKMFDKIAKLIDEVNSKPRVYVKKLSIAKGYSIYDSTKDKDYNDAFKRADESMYKEKEEYYETHNKKR